MNEWAGEQITESDCKWVNSWMCYWGCASTSDSVNECLMLQYVFIIVIIGHSNSKPI